MISMIEALNYRSLRYIRQPLDNFHVLIGPNASGKTTFLDVVSFLGQLMTDGLESAITERTENFVDLLWMRRGTKFELAIEVVLPETIQFALLKDHSTTIRYEIVVGILPESEAQEVGILKESVFLKRTSTGEQESRLQFPEITLAPDTILQGYKPSWQVIVSKNQKGKYTYTPEIADAGISWSPRLKLRPSKSAMIWAVLDEASFPASAWLMQLLSDGMQSVVLNSAAILLPSPPNRRGGYRTDGSNLPWVIDELQRIPARYNDWIRHLQTSLPDLIAVYTILRPEDRHRYLMLEYTNGLKVPSWMVSDGTLRMLALTLLAYLPNSKGIYLIEEPENGIHPTAVETVFQSLSSVYDAQLLLATHSPVVLNCATAKSLLCFAKNDEGATDIVSGENHPRLQEWKGKTNLGVMFASGVLG